MSVESENVRSPEQDWKEISRLLENLVEPERLQEVQRLRGASVMEPTLNGEDSNGWYLDVRLPERPSGGAQGGQFMRESVASNHEIAAFIVSEVFEFDVVPATVPKVVDHMAGAFREDLPQDAKPVNQGPIQRTANVKNPNNPAQVAKAFFGTKSREQARQHVKKDLLAALIDRRVGDPDTDVLYSEEEQQIFMINNGSAFEIERNKEVLGAVLYTIDLVFRGKDAGLIRKDFIPRFIELAKDHEKMMQLKNVLGYFLSNEEIGMLFGRLDVLCDHAEKFANKRLVL